MVGAERGARRTRMMNRRIGSGLAEASPALRLRYEIRRSLLRTPASSGLVLG